MKWEEIKKAHAELFRIIVMDLSGVIRCKCVAIRGESYENMVQNGIGWVGMQWGMPIFADVRSNDVSSLVSAGVEVMVVPDPETAVLLSNWNANDRLLQAAAIGNAFEKLNSSGSHIQRNPFCLCPRQFLTRMTKKLQEKYGLTLKAGFELEFVVQNKDNTPIDTSAYAQNSVLDDVGGSVLEGILKRLHSIGIPVEVLHAESGFGQLEISVRYADALTACDRNVFLRMACRSTCISKGLLLSLAPKTFGAGNVGSGMHVHFSLWKDGNNVSGTHLEDSQKTDLSQTMKHFLAGIAITVGSRNGFSRVKPAMWVGDKKCWGWDQRECPIRAVKDWDGASSHVELKLCDASCNPYLALGALIAVGMDGLEKSIALEDPVSVEETGIFRVDAQGCKSKYTPDSIISDQPTALAELEKNETLKEAMGEQLHQTYIGVKRTENKHFEETQEQEVACLRDRL